ncbi:spermidine/putrescine transport system permease protein [Pararhizobium capsulatum DSM 1112]|uniref:Spermidine/putrescine transport system permease protein n=1 Tax=Pararhizobium capsulatum DSM 1112 TaxID=1121113 RepID=A0ABU0BS97_9HYPH|nr:ABC transporter permease [Pararhizobium capsulatum]MDQ0321115.1 spermidine/putrescine transport system permease protein [Pararhizobium capsulatum DSM 1112]
MSGMAKNRLPGRIVLLVVFGFLYLPIAVLVMLSFNESGLPTSWSGFSTRWYVSLAGNSEILHAAWNTLVVAIFATLISTVLGTLLAIGMETRARKSNGLEALAFAPMVIPDIVLAVALLTFFSRLNVATGLHTIILSHVIFDLAFVCSVVRARLKHFDFSIVEASRDLGASGWTTFWRVTFPVLLPSIIAGALLAFTLSVDEFIIAFFTAGPGRSSITLPMQIYSMIRFGITPEVNALATIVMAVSATALLLSQWLNKEQIQ